MLMFLNLLKLILGLAVMGLCTFLIFYSGTFVFVDRVAITPCLSRGLYADHEFDMALGLDFRNSPFGCELQWRRASDGS